MATLRQTCDPEASANPSRGLPEIGNRILGTRSRRGDRDRKSRRSRLVTLRCRRRRDITLPRPASQSRVSIEQALGQRRSQRSFRPDPITLEALGQLLWAANGLNAKGREPYLRTAPSAGGLHPVDLFVVVGEPGVVGLTAGVYAYDPIGHAVTPVAPVTPAIPVTPVLPVTPVAPVLPVAPVAPTPVAPVAPVAPGEPATFSTTDTTHMLSKIPAYLPSGFSYIPMTQRHMGFSRHSL